ncbi:SE1561 family protein [Tepidibacillus sp. LV47]|uniref:SE1561 family protein n=1 Tax=Tepidibacillus sp. LV47 TaxID=3398228 RepID=UPI003AACD61A
MSKPIYDKKKQLQYIKDKLQLITYMVDQLNPDSIQLEDFQYIAEELKDLIVKTNMFHFRHETAKKEGVTVK